MFQLLNRITWIISIVLWIAIFAIEEDFFLFALVAVFAVKFFIFSPNYIRKRLQFFKKQVLKGYNPEQGEKVENISVSSPTEIEPEEIIPVQENLAFSENSTDIKTETSEIYEQNINAVPEQENSNPNIIKRFFSENLLAKVWWILVFLGVLFFLSLVYSVIGPVAKMCIGFAIGFSCYTAGVWLDKKWFTQESRIVMGIAILINYLVILSGRFLLWDDSSSTGTLLSVGLTFAFLILNTIFSVITALLYNSRTLLILGFVFAYINPFLLGTSSSEPYTLLGYTMIVTLWALFLSYTKKDTILFPLSFIFAAIIFLIAPWHNAAGWITKLLCINTLWALALYTSTVFKKSFQHLSEILIAGTFFLIAVMGLLWIEDLSNVHLMILWASSLSLMAFCYISSKRWVYLYSLGSIGTILTLSPAIYMLSPAVHINGREPEMFGVSFIIIAIFALMNLWYIFTKAKNIIADNLGNIISGLLSGALFLTYMIYLFGNDLFPGMIQWFCFFALACIYCFLAFFMVHQIGIETMKKEEKYENIFYTISAIGLSLFSLAVAFIFSESKEIVSIVWLLEANVLFFLCKKTNSLKIAIAGLILFIIGIIKFADFIDFNPFWGKSFTWDYGMLVALCIVLASLIYNLILLFHKKTCVSSKVFYGIHNYFHLTGISLVAFTAHNILDISTGWNSLLYFSIVISTLGALYARISSPWLKIMHLIAYIMLMLIHIVIFADDIWTDRVDLVISTIIAGIYALPFIYDRAIRWSVKNKTLLSVFLGYLFILSTLYVYHIFMITFAVTLYWGILSFILLSYGISKDILYLRTIGLYLITLTATKIFLYDIWMSVDDTVSRVAALIIVGILMIILSTMYTRKYGNTLNSEFNPSNLFPKSKDVSNKTSITKTQEFKKDIGE